jgi:hypothetical protein
LKRYNGMTKLVLSCNVLFTGLYLLKFYAILYVGNFEMQKRGPWKKNVFSFYLNTEGYHLFLTTTMPHHSFGLQNSIPKGLGFICGLSLVWGGHSFLLDLLEFSNRSKYKCNLNVHFTMLLPTVKSNAVQKHTQASAWELKQN